MKPKVILLLGAVLVSILFISSCAEQGGYRNSPPHPSATAEGAARDSRKSRVEEDRPGLATGWGDEKESKLRNVSFTRSSSKPKGTDAIFYNDREGIEAMSNRPQKVGAMQTAAGGLVEWGIKGGGFGYLPAYKENGWGRRLVAGSKGNSYSIVVKNRSKSDLEIVASVDGLDVQDGKTATFSKRGYIVAPGKSLEIEGFRTSYSKVAAFEFSSVSNSYANLRHGDTRNVGVIGIAVFTQKGVDPWKSAEVQRRENARTFAEAP
ncbi:MAG: hypothetical protein ABJQ29_10290 [Luteolibacter sp.]